MISVLNKPQGVDKPYQQQITQSISNTEMHWRIDIAHRSATIPSSDKQRFLRYVNCAKQRS